MKVLLSAYACEPGKGSEPGLGWHWALAIARRGHMVHVITRANNRKSIAVALASGELAGNLVFHYYDLPPRLRFWKRGQRGVHLYALLWQWGATQLALRLHARERFDLVHHVSFASIRLPSFMGRLGIPFILGPLGGGEIAPRALRRSYPLSGKLADSFRDLSNLLVRIDPLMCRTFASADQIWLRGPENRALIPAFNAHKIHHHIGLGIDAPPPLTSRTSSGTFRVLYVGRFLHWKGMHLGLPAFAEARRHLRERGQDITLTMVGAGPEERRWKAQAERLGIGSVVSWIAPVPQRALSDIYAAHDLLLFPSLHDSGGMVVLEAAAHGLPTLCLDRGGPGALVSDKTGIKIPTGGRSETAVVTTLARAMLDIAATPARHAALRVTTRDWAATMSWDAAAAAIYAPLETAAISTTRALA